MKGLLNCLKNKIILENFFLASSSLGPFFFKRAFASFKERPFKEDFKSVRQTLAEIE
jgi:hypothetical protein